MREIHVDEIRDNVAQICIEAAYDLSEDVCTAFDRAQEIETSPAAKEVIGLLKENARIAREDLVPICQDTGISTPAGSPLLLIQGVSVRELIETLNRLGASPRDLIAILQAIRAAGALQAELTLI